MQDAEDHHVLFKTLGHREREAAQEGAADRSANQLMTAWRFGKSLENGESLVEKLLGQSSLLLLVPQCRFGHVLFRLRADADVACHRRRRILKTTSVANCPR
jgi:hypothetical protein